MIGTVSEDASQLRRVNRGTAIAVGLNDRVTLQHAVGFRHRSTVNLEVAGKLLDRRQGVSREQVAAEDGLLDLANQLITHGDRSVEVDDYFHG